jgi:hypothetical protein
MRLDSMAIVSHPRRARLATLNKSEALPGAYRKICNFEAGSRARRYSPAAAYADVKKGACVPSFTNWIWWKLKKKA